ncbi:MAG: hypothetical protein N2747_03725 [Chitinophagaceae bacterium]|nr:hypothetical protein [Chitinophagaceae bacterium]
MVSYTLKDRLPSNSIYRTLQDKYGFLWVSTENGLARFDGRKFETYTTAHGLPDNEIIDIFTDSNQIIWAIPFRRSPCFYLENESVFASENTDAELKAIDLGNSHNVSVLSSGGVAFYNHLLDIFLYKQGKTTVIKKITSKKSSLPVKVIEYAPESFLCVAQDSLRYFMHNGIYKQFYFGETFQNILYHSGKIFLQKGNQIKVYGIKKQGELHFLFQKEFPFPIQIFCFTGKRFAVTSANSYTYLLDKDNLEIRENIINNILVRNILEDNDGNIWVSTLENGLIKIQLKRISSYTDIPDLNQHFNTILKNNKIIVGNNKGEIYVYDGLYDIKKSISTNPTT